MPNVGHPVRLNWRAMHGKRGLNNDGSGLRDNGTPRGHGVWNERSIALDRLKREIPTHRELSRQSPERRS
jgi:hypothetical protein